MKTFNSGLIFNKYYNIIIKVFEFFFTFFGFSIASAVVTLSLLSELLTDVETEVKFCDTLCVTLITVLALALLSVSVIELGVGVLELALRFFEGLILSLTELAVLKLEFELSPKTISPVGALTLSFKFALGNFTLSLLETFCNAGELLSIVFTSASVWCELITVVSFSTFFTTLLTELEDEKFLLELLSIVLVCFVELDVDDEWTVFWWELDELEFDLLVELLDFDDELLDLLLLELLLRFPAEELELWGIILLFILAPSASFSGEESEEWLSVGIGLYGGIVFTFPPFF